MRLVTRESDLSAPLKHLLAVHPAVAWAARANVGSGFLIPGRVMQEIIAAFGGKAAFEKRFGKQRWIEFGIPGLPDFIGQLKNSGKFLGIETKRPNFHPCSITVEQRTFQELVNDNGGLAFVTSDISRANDVLNGAPLRDAAGFCM